MPVSMEVDMRLTALAIVAALVISPAAADTGPKILTIGKDARTDRTPGVTIEDTRGVHLIRGSQKLLGDEQTPENTAEQTIEVEIIRPIFVTRTFRRLRTQGFYSGKPYPSRRFTQGFYSGRR